MSDSFGMRPSRCLLSGFDERASANIPDRNLEPFEDEYARGMVARQQGKDSEKGIRELLGREAQYQAC